MKTARRSPRPRLRTTMLVLAPLLATAACSRSELSIPATTTTTVVAPTSSDVTEAAPEPEAQPTSVSETTITTLPGGSSNAADTTTLPPVVTVGPISVAEIDEVGTPGLDSDDAFCAAWSRFAGSFQVVAVTAAFGSGPPEQLAALEVAAAPVVTSAYDDLFANWPEELDAETELVADRFLGPFYRRLAEAHRALEASGADAATIDAVGAAWLDGLARRDPTTPEFVLDLPDEVWAEIDAAAAEFAARRVPFSEDPSLVTDVETPLTSSYLAVSCPDQGTLSGQEVDTP